MSGSTAAPPVSAKAKRRPPMRGEGNPAKAGWVTKGVITALCVLWFVPVLGTVITSFRTLDAANTSGWWEVFYKPSTWESFTFGNYDTALTSEGIEMGNAFINSFAITLPATFIPVLIAAFASYAFTFMDFPGRDTLFLIVVGLLVVPYWVAFVPMLKIYGQFQLAGTFPAVWLAHVGFGMSLAVFIFRNYMSTLPKTVIESAKIDGASHFQTFYRLVLPMSAPALASFAIFQFLWVWNDLFAALVFIGPGENEPVTVAMASLRGQMGQGWNLQTAGGFVSMVVPIIVFLTLQRYFVRGMTAGAVKG